MTPRVSVVITAHNAAGTIAECLRAVARQDGVAPGEFEIVFVDDRSTDGTLAAAGALGIDELSTVRVDDLPPAGLTSRQVALDRGIRTARAPIVCLTDADGIPDARWVAGAVAALERRQADLVAGPVVFRPEHQWLGALQTVDSAFYTAWCRMLAALGAEAGVMFGNAAFRKDAYVRVGGFSAIGHSLTEDLAFARAVKRAKLKTAYRWRAGVSVAACSTFVDLLRRSTRTSTGGVSVLFASIVIWILLLPILAIAALTTGSSWWTAAFVTRWAGAVMLNVTATAAAGGWRALWMAPLYDLATPVLGSLVIVYGLGRTRVSWGGIDYDRR